MTVTTRLKTVVPEPAKTLARQGFRTYGTWTSVRRPLPDYLIIGTKRGGTTSMWDHVARHPNVLPMFPEVENVKSPHYFDMNWHLGESWYRSHFPHQRARDAVAERTGGPVLAGEASPYYMFHPLARDRIKQTRPDMKLIVLLRNPVERAYSHYNERRRAGTEDLGFREALQAESDRLSGEEDKIREVPAYYSTRHDFCSYLARGRYLEQLEPWLADFGPDRLLVVRSEDLYESPNKLLAGVFEFLGLPPYELQNPEHRNNLPAAPMPSSDRHWLADYYQDSVAALEARLGRSFDWNLRGD